MQRTNDIDVKIEEGRFIAERIPGARFLELEGDDHLFWVGDTAKILQEIKAFILEIRPKARHERKLFTLAVARIISDEKANSTQREYIAQFVAKYRGEVIQCDGRTFIATFEGPSKAVHCNMDLLETLKSMDVQLSVGVHIKGGAVNEAHLVREETERFLESILKHAEPDQILITQTVKYLLSGAGLNFAENKSVFEFTSGEPILLYTVTDDSRAYDQTTTIDFGQLPKYDSILESVLQCIDVHLDDEIFGVEVLCKEIGVSERQLQRKLKAITNKSPIQLISSVRLHRAKELLLQHRNNISEIAYQTGFSNPSISQNPLRKNLD